jgi:2-dehydro-3-deoxyphosphogluconate aldolase / (4S)-4-hydroxy-2-oxoglutarate aldolase
MNQVPIAMSPSDPGATMPAIAIDMNRRVLPRRKEQIRERISEVGVIPAVRAACLEDALFAAEAVIAAGIPIVEISAAMPRAADVISHLAKHVPEAIVGAGNITSVHSARQCLQAGAKFLSTDGLLTDVVELAAEHDAVVMAGALTPSEVLAAWNTGPDFVRVYPCNAMGGPSYVRALQDAFPAARLIAAGGVSQSTGLEYIGAGAAAVIAGRYLFPAEAIRLRQQTRIQELGRRLLHKIDSGRAAN